MSTPERAAEERIAMADEGQALEREGNRLMLSGSAIGVASVASAALLGATCPLCLVGVPAIIGYGLAQRVRGQRMQAHALRAAGSPEALVDPTAPPDGEAGT